MEAGRRSLDQRQVRANDRLLSKPFGIVRRSALTAKLHELDPQAYLADVLERIVSGRTKSHQLHELLAWNWKVARQRTAQAAA
ncbi:hypothetical protein ACVJGD_008566 [Bradyrhizobium sp. USDA 10063]